VTAGKRLTFFAVLLLVAAGLAEVTLRIAAHFWPKPDYRLTAPISPTVPDAQLGIRGNPAYPGHDAKGFRNPYVPDTASVVALGDSQTYGVGVLPDQAWPRQSEQLSGLTTYSMALGSYGPTHSLLLLDDALALHPKLVIEAFYAGNDLFDSYAHVYRNGQLPELKSVDRAVLHEIDSAEAAGPLEEKTRNLFQAALLWTEPPPPPADTLWDVLGDEVQLLHLAREFGHRVALATGRYGHDQRQFDEEYWATVKREVRRAVDQRTLVESGQLRTVLTPAYRLCAVDLSDPRIAEGLRISLDAIGRMNERVHAAHAAFAVLLLPTKYSISQVR